MLDRPHGHTAAVRRFNRFYTRAIGILGDTYLTPDFSLTAGRVLYELAHRDGATATALRQDLGIDAGYLSRILADFEKRGFLARTPSRSDRRASELALTEAGRAAFLGLDARSEAEIDGLIASLAPGDRDRLAGAMAEIETLLEPRPDAEPFTLRSHRPGDIGWVVERHGALYAQEYGWDERFEALVAEIAAGFIKTFDPARERCWIAERAGRRVGSVFLVRERDAVAKLRLLLVDPAARGLGLGQRLVAECIAFARQAGYGRLTLWTQRNLDAARHIYAKAGFRMVHSEPYQGIGRDLVSEIWDLDLRAESGSIGPCGSDGCSA
ncbi:bifunctional helix-turn-helix transcriptional regulator/GNAT family N-acetyltransferase [Labrys wisconsinensis]|uniref:DNA-binding MarR family transcriptional regulator/GNAT superfamily N-acetyltransferase n=1 Tax=Labrys wisconsinensis TaxID=425677 RepID=A0ABU0J1F1_9HYPH|nr:helix-turn-helix domain-containing GNAT family N-acetyltransferase [Labrys wisconsinensis]MDQ0468083.1 DNA-binding MarR family transcriptional regulator/GNAT superfamily N-acetyltransferase [Labrys wisconsinensis]